METPEIAEQSDNQHVGLLPQEKRLVSLASHVRQALPCARRLSISRDARHELGRGAAAGIDDRQSTRANQRNSVLPRPTRALPSAPHLHQNTPAGSNALQSLIVYPTKPPQASCAGVYRRLCTAKAGRTAWKRGAAVPPPRA